MSLLLLTGPLWWLPLSQLHVVGVEGESGMGRGRGGETEGHVGTVRGEKRKDVKRKVME